MAVANQGSFFSRFTIKFVEVIGAGVATAITGYLIAHLGGFWAAPRTPAAIPATVQMEPAVTAVPKSARVVPAVPVAVEANIQPSAAKTEVAKPEAAPAKEAAVPPARKRAPEAAAIEAKPRQPEAKPADKDDTASVEEQVRAALAKVDANRRSLPEPAAPIESAPPAPAAVTVPPAPAAAAPDVAAVPAARPLAINPPSAPAAVAVAPPLGTVEIKSQPVATVDAAPAAAEAPAQASAQPEDKGIFAALKKIPEMLRPVSGATSTPPRPPMPVGE